MGEGRGAGGVLAELAREHEQVACWLTPRRVERLEEAARRHDPDEKGRRTHSDDLLEVVAEPVQVETPEKVDVALLTAVLVAEAAASPVCLAPVECSRLLSLHDPTA